MREAAGGRQPAAAKPALYNKNAEWFTNLPAQCAPVPAPVLAIVELYAMLMTTSVVVVLLVDDCATNITSTTDVLLSACASTQDYTSRVDL